MTKVISATYDGAVLRLDEPLPVAPNTRILLTLHDDSDDAAPASFIETALSLNVDGPPDWATRLDAYLYGDLVGDDDR